MKTKCFCGRESATPRMMKHVSSGVASKACWSCERNKTRGLRGKAQEENTCPQTLQGSNTPGGVEEGR